MTDRTSLREFPPRIPVIPEEMARAITKGLPKKKWDFLERPKQQGSR